MKLRTLTKREKVFLYLSLGVLFSTLVFNFLISPFISKQAQVNNEIEKKTFVLRKYSRLIKKGKNILSLYEDYKETLETGFSSEDIAAALFNEIENAARRFDLNLEKIKPQPIEEKNEYKIVSFEIEAQGNFSSIFNFINHLEGSSSFIRVSSLRIASVSRISSSLRCKVILSKIFFGTKSKSKNLGQTISVSY